MSCQQCGHYAAPGERLCGDCVATQPVAINPNNPLSRAVSSDRTPIGPLPMPTRQEIREYVAVLFSDARVHEQRGGNRQQWLLDSGDRLEARFAMLLPESDRATFVQLYIEEMHAARSQIEADMEREGIKQIGKAASSYTVMSTVSFVVIALFLTMIARAC